jgi:Ca-activated chloride channel homolog
MISTKKNLTNQLIISLKLMIILLICINLLASFFVGANGYSQASIEPKATAGSFQLTNPTQQRSSALILSTHVNMAISGLTARVTVTQKFKNNGDQWMEGLYQFPLPDKAAVDHLSIKIGERLIVGEIHEKQQAKRIYQKAKISGKKASLVEQQRPNLFSNRVANIGPYEIIETIIEYQQDVVFERDSGFSIRFPMTFTPRYQSDNVSQVLVNDLDYSKIGRLSFSAKQGQLRTQVSQFGQNRRMLLPIERDDNYSNANGPSYGQNLASISIQLDSGIPLQSLSSPTHSIYQQQKSERLYQISFQSELVKADHDFVLHWLPEESKQPKAALFSERKAGENYLSLMILPPSTKGLLVRPLAREVIFVIDTSGSMAGVSMQQAKKALSFGLSSLTSKDKFNIIQFNSVTESLFSNAKPVNPKNIDIAGNYIQQLNAEGGTEMYPALDASLSQSADLSLLRQVIFLTDGAISNEAKLFELISKKLGDSRLYTVGIGSAPNTFFMKRAARYGRGTFTFIADISESQKQIESLFATISRPQLSHINIQWPDNISSEVWPQRIPDLYDGEPLWLKARVSRLQGLINITGQMSDSRWSNQLDLATSNQQPGIAVLWAREKIGSIMNTAAHGRINETQKRQIIDTAIEHHLVSRFTSLVAVDKTPSRLSEQLIQQKLKNSPPKGQLNSTGVSNINYARTGLDLDIDFQRSFYLLLASLLALFFHRRMLQQ